MTRVLFRVIFLAVVALSVLSSFYPSVASAQGPLTNGVTTQGTISSAGQTDSWTFAASAGDAIIVRVGNVVNTGFTLGIQLLSPTSVLLGTSSGSPATEIAITATNTGTFTVRIGDNSGTQTNAYRVTLAKTGSPVVIAPGDTGGPLTNGLTTIGTIDTGDLDVWTVTATNGNAVVVRVGVTNNFNGFFAPQVRIYSPTGVLLDSAAGQDGNAAEVAITATNSGTFLVVVGDGYNASYPGAGIYRITLAQTGEPVVIAPGDTGGPLTNGLTTVGTIDVGDLDVWTVTATNGNAVVVRMGVTNNFNGFFAPQVRIYSPTGVLLDSAAGQDGNATEVAITATNSGTFLVVVGDGYNASYPGAGIYRITLAQTGEPVVIASGDTGGPLTNGLTTIGTIDVGDLDVWTVTATNGNAVVVRMGVTNNVNGFFAPQVRIYSPTGVLLGSFVGQPGNAAEVAITATNSGTFLVVVGDGYNTSYPGAGIYRITLAQTGEPVVIAPGEQGGPLTNGLTTIGTIHVGSLDLWTVTATNGNAVVVRMGVTNNVNGFFAPQVRIYSPTGVLLGSFVGQPGNAAEVAITATNSGTFLVVVGDGYNASYPGAGIYRLTLAQIPGAFVVGAGDEGGWLVNSNSQTGVITVGDLDMWKFCAGTGTNIFIQITDLINTNGFFTPQIRLYGPDGALLNTAANTTVATISRTATNSGTFIVVVGDGYNTSYPGAGTYRLLATGITVCVSCSLSPQLATNVVGTAHTVTDFVFTNDDLAVGVPVSFSVTTGPNVGDSGTATTSLLGQGSFTYIGSAVTGIDTIRAIANFAGFLRTNTVTKVWVTPFEGWQISYFGGTGNPAAAPNLDPDGDGISNTNEFLAGFDPTDSAAYLHIISIVRTNNSVVVTYLGANGDNTWLPGFASRTNVLEFTKGAADGSYTTNFVSTGQTNILSGGNGLGVVTNFIEVGGATNIPSRYYRVRVLAP